MERGAKQKPRFSQWAWSSRKKRSLEKAASDLLQSRITDYWKILSNIEKLARENEKLSLLLLQAYDTSCEPCSHVSFTTILKEMICNAEKNCGQYRTHRRHPIILKKFATALFLLAGPLAYEFIHQNMPEALPCVRSIQAAIHSEYKTIHEGTFRFDELREHLDQYGAPAIVSVGEDATRVVGKIEYDSETDKCVGFVLPLNENSLPIVDSFIAVSFSAIENMFQQHSIAKYAYVYMAQPLCNNVPPVCLACLGTNNKFCAENVMPRWKYISEECTKRNISVLSFGGDGDSRLMKCMKVATSMIIPLSKPLSKNIPSNKLLSTPVIPRSWQGWFHIKPKEITFVQDTVHLAVKLKSRLLKPQIALRMGDYTATGGHV